MLKAVLFDLDGVIIDSAKYHYLAWKELADQMEIPFNEIYNEKLKGVSRMESLELILENGNKKEAFTPEDILPGIRELLTELRNHQIKTCICSVSKNAVFIISQLELLDYFNHIVDAAKVKNAKPASDLFAIGAYVLGAFPTECIGVEDARAGIEAKKKEPA